jgi:hypothetical protein
MSVFQMNLDDYPHLFLAEDRRLCSYNGDAPIYHCHLSIANGLDVCKVSVMIPFHPTEPWSGSIVGSEPDTTVEMMAHAALTSLCESHLGATAALPIAILSIRN